jgi:hypothetical protein
MNILDAPNIVNSINPDTATERLPGDVAYVMAAGKLVTDLPR